VPVIEAAARTRATLKVMDGVLQTMTVRAERMRHLAEIGFGTATELADVIVRETGLSFRMAHNIVGAVVRDAIEARRTALTITASDLDRAAQTLFGQALGINPDVVRKALDPAENIKLRTVVGGPAHVREMADRRTRALEADRSAIATVRNRIGDATQRLNAAAQRIAAKG